MHHPTDRITHTTAFITPVVEHWLEREIAQWVHFYFACCDTAPDINSSKYRAKYSSVFICYSSEIEVNCS